MLFYKIQSILREQNKALTEKEKKPRGEIAHELSLRSDMYNESVDKDSHCFVVDFSATTLDVCVIVDCKEKLVPAVDGFLRFLDLPPDKFNVTEITYNTFKSLLHKAYRCDLVEDDDAVIQKFRLDLLENRRSVRFGEGIVDWREREELSAVATEYCMEETLLPELERIYREKSNSAAIGHPVHYMVESDNADTRREIYKVLLDALYANGRLESKRYVYLNIGPDTSVPPNAYEILYAFCKGGALVVRYMAEEESDGEFEDVARTGGDAIAALCTVAKRYRNDVLTVFCLPRESRKVKTMFLENLDTVSIVELREDLIPYDRAKQMLSTLAKKRHIRTDKKLFAPLELDKIYIAPELREFFDTWYSTKLKTSVYPQYKEIATVKKDIVKAKPRGSAYDELDAMVGLAEAKGVIRKALNYYKMQKLYQARGFKEDHPAMHMVFSGNPGTAKTTVARLFARIMRENGLLTKGHLVEVGRGDLVGKYVGWTATNVHAKFMAAKGGVLFIDEAYSLVDDRSGSFGDEAINTIVQEMENHREDVVVIFAGYPIEMDNFLQKNPGLRSRIAFHVPFADYSSDELCEIARHIGRGNGIAFEDAAMEKLKRLFESAGKQIDFGNGRFVRNVFEQAKMNQASRLIEMDFDDISDEAIATIIAEDIDLPRLEKKKAEKKIGFC